MKFTLDSNYNPDNYVGRISTPVYEKINKKHEEWLATKPRHRFGMLESNPSLFMMVGSYFTYRADVLHCDSHSDDKELQRYSSALEAMRVYTDIGDFAFVQNKAIAEVLMWRDLNGVTSGDRKIPDVNRIHSSYDVRDYPIYQVSIQQWYDIFSTVLEQPETLSYFEHGVTDIQQAQFYLAQGIDAELAQSLSTNKNILITS